MPNQWEELAKGFINAGGTIGNAFIEKGIKNDAEEMNRKGREFLQNQTAKLNEWNMNLLANANGDNEVITQEKNVSTPYEKTTQEDYNKIFQDTQIGINDIMTKLANNKYGKTYAEGLNSLYNQLFAKTQPEYEFIKGSDNSITAINKKTLQTKELRKGTEKPDSWTYQDIKTDNPDGSQTVTQFAIDKTNPDNKKTLGTYTIPKDEPKLTGRRVSRTGRSNPEDGLTNKEIAFNNTMKAYEEAVKSGNEKRQGEIKQSFSDTWGRDIESSYQKWGYTPNSTKKNKSFLKDEVKDYDQFNEAYNQTYFRDKIGKGGQSLDSWFKTLYQAPNRETLDAWYDEMWDYLEGIGNQLDNEVYNRIGKSLNSYYNDANK